METIDFEFRVCVVWLDVLVEWRTKKSSTVFFPFLKGKLQLHEMETVAR